MSVSVDGSVPLKNVRWEKFCGYATGYAGNEPMFATDAYMLAYPRSKRSAARGNAARLAARAEVRARCEWLRQELNEAGKMDAAGIRAKIVRLRLEVIDKMKATSNKHLALQAARDLDRMMGFQGGAGGGAISKVQEELAQGGQVLESITLNVKKLLAGEGGEVRGEG